MDLLVRLMSGAQGLSCLLLFAYSFNLFACISDFIFHTSLPDMDVAVDQRSWSQTWNFAHLLHLH